MKPIKLKDLLESYPKYTYNQSNLKSNMLILISRLENTVNSINSGDLELREITELESKLSSLIKILNSIKSDWDK